MRNLLANIRTDARRTLTRLLRPASIVVCECNAWDKYLVQAVCPDAQRIAIHPGESGARLSKAIGRRARVVVMHIDTSQTDGVLQQESALYDSLAARGVITLNAHATDVRKRTLHERLAASGLPSASAPRSGPADERLILKTNLNAAGGPERRLVARRPRTTDQFMGDLNEEMRVQEAYRVCRRDEVPDAAWLDPTLVIERFLENPEGAYFRVHGFGPATVVSQIWTDHAIKHQRFGAHRREHFFFWTVGGEDVAIGKASPEAMRAAGVGRRAAMAMQMEFYGTDCVMDANGVIVPVDVNKTPYWGTPEPRPGVLEHLRLGLEFALSHIHGDGSARVTS
jgi:hypothetical protein